MVPEIGGRWIIFEVLLNVVVSVVRDIVGIAGMTSLSIVVVLTHQLMVLGRDLFKSI